MVSQHERRRLRLETLALALAVAAVLATLLLLGWCRSQPLQIAPSGPAPVATTSSGPPAATTNPTAMPTPSGGEGKG
jgi:hypothetical protein